MQKTAFADPQADQAGISVQTASLYFKEGASDKEYHASINPKNKGYVVNFAYGRRGSTLQTGTKTSIPVDFDTATEVFTKLIAQKRAKGYTEGEAGTPYQHTGQEDRVTNILPQLLNPVDESELDLLMENDNWCAQEKFDGRRILLRKEGAAIHGINRKGLLVGLPSSVVVAAHGLQGDFIVDGESIGDYLHVFDLLSRDGEDLRSLVYRHRFTGLMNLLGTDKPRRILLTATAWTHVDKRELLMTLREQNKEGIVFKKTEAPYLAGRPSSGGSQLKYKFYATLSAVVASVNARRSVEINLRKGNRWVTAGNVAIPPNHAVPTVGQVVEVRYLYAFEESGCVYQPVYLGLRSDVLETECVTSQLKFKNSEAE